jgi:hypothetical protein
MPDAKKPADPPPQTSAERQRNYRKRKAEEAAAHQAQALFDAEPARNARNGDSDDVALRDGDAAATSTAKAFALVRSVEDAIAHMKWIQPTDGALVDMAKLYAVQIDMVLQLDPTATGKAASLGQLLTRILHELGGTPTVRLQRELRSLRAQLATPTGGEDANQNDERATGTEDARPSNGNVTPIRPPKRKR